MSEQNEFAQGGMTIRADQISSGVIRAASPVQNQLSRLENGLTNLDSKLGELYDKLESVLGPDLPSDVNKLAGQDSPETSRLVMALEDRADTLFRLTERLDTIIGRVQL